MVIDSMTKLKTLNDMDKCLKGCQNCVSKEDLRKEALKWATSLNLWCKVCGSKADYFYEGELQCPNADKEVGEKGLEVALQHLNNSRLGNWDDMGAYNILMKLFNLEENNIKTQVLLNHKSIIK